MIELVILDYTNSEVHFYTIPSTTTVDEGYISKLGFNMNSCDWMVSDSIGIYKHKI